MTDQPNMPALAPYYVLLIAEPTAAAPNAHDIGGAIVHCIVMADSPATALVLARSHLMNYAWVVRADEEAVDLIQPEQIPNLDAADTALLATARTRGIAVFFSAWQKDAQPEDAPVQLRAVGSPPPTSTTKN